MQPINNEYQDLANAVVAQAAQDYRDALDGKSYTRKKKAAEVVIELEKFFHSDYYRTLTKVDGEYLIEQLQKEHREKRKKERLCKSH